MTQETQDKIVEIKRLLAIMPHMSISDIARKCKVARRYVYSVKDGEIDRERTIERCPRCGEMVAMPCIACCVRSLPRRDICDVPVTLGLNLKPVHHKRYLQVLAARQLHQHNEAIQ